jgi:hypothetical protein
MKSLRGAGSLLKTMVILLLTPVFCLGQERFGGLQGTVSDDTQAVLPGVTVTLINNATGRMATTSAGAYGNYTASKLEPGRYSVFFELPGFSRTEVANVDVLVGRNLKLDITLKPGGPATAVQVTDFRASVDTQNSSVIFQMPKDQFELLPRGRTFQSLAILAPRVQSGEIEGGIQINGASSAENAFVIDGVATGSVIDGQSRQNAPFEYIQEVQVQTAGVEAGYRGGLGGIISAVTRSGGDAFHGNAWFYYSGDALNSAPPRRLVLDPADNRTVSYQQDSKTEARGLEPGFSLGGPIRRDFAYFFTAWSRRWNRQEQSYGFSNGAEPGVIPRERKSLSGFNKISIEPASRVRGNLTWLWTPAEAKGTLPVYNGACPDCLSSTLASNAVNGERGFFNPQSSYSVNMDVVVRSNVLLSSRLSYFWDNYKDTGIPNLTSVQYQSPAQAPLVPANLQGAVGFQNTPAILKHDHDLVARTTGQFDVAITTGLAGVHNIKTGYAVEKSVNDVNAFYPGGFVHVWWDQSFTSPVTNTADRGTYGYYEVNDFRKLGSAGGRTKSLYAQDNWRVSDRLTLNAGVRIEAEQVPSFNRQFAKSAIEFGWGDKVAPRIGGAYDLLGDGNVKLFASWGRYFDPVRYDLARNVFGGETWQTHYRSLDTLDVFSLNLGNMPGRNLWNSGNPLFRDRRNAAAGLRSVERELKPMSQDQWSAGADFQWNPKTTIGVHYVHQQLRHAIEDLAVVVSGNVSYIYANPGEGSAVNDPLVTGLTAKPLPYPKPQRDYDAVDVIITRRIANHWSGAFSYTWSRLYGNYSGTASSDEILTPATGVSYDTAQQQGGSIAHPARYASLAWDLDEVLFDASGHLDPRGNLATDRTHVFKWNGSYGFDFHGMGRTNLGAFFYLGSGTPLSTQVWTKNLLPVLVMGRGDLGRTPMLNYTDLQIAHTFDIGDTQTVRVEMDVFNVFNQRTVRHRFTALNRGTGVFVPSAAIDLSKVDLRQGYDYNALIGATTDGANAFDPRYGKDDLFSDGVSAALAVRWSF